MDKKQREARRQQEDIALQRGLLWVVGAVVLEVLLALLNRFYVNYPLTESGINIFMALNEALKVVRIAAPIAAVLALLWSIRQAGQGKKYAPALIAAIALAALTVCVHVAVKYRADGMSMLYWLVIAWAVLAMVFYIYQREFFLAATACGMSVLALWFVRYGVTGRMEAIVLTAAILVVGVAALLLKKNDGTLNGKEALRFLPKESDYGVMLATCLASLAAVVIALLAGGTLSYYLVYVMIAWLFALFVYYTVKLM